MTHRDTPLQHMQCRFNQADDIRLISSHLIPSHPMQRRMQVVGCCLKCGEEHPRYDGDGRRSSTHKSIQDEQFLFLFQPASE